MQIKTSSQVFSRRAGLPVAFAATTAVLGLLASSPGYANNGFLVIGFGAESTAMGGADVAVARDTTALNTNPAGLIQIRSAAADGYVSAASSLDSRYSDAQGNDTRPDKTTFYGLGGGYAQRIAHSNFVAGIGIFGVGQAGAEYKNLATAFGTNDDVGSQTSFIKLSPGIAWRYSESLSFGASLGIVHAEMWEKFFPNTSFFNFLNPTASFFNIDMEGIKANSVQPRIGVRYQPRESLVLALAYAPETRLTFEGGNVVLNETSHPLVGSKVTYRKVKFQGLALPQELRAGAAFRPMPKLLVSTEVSWLDWSSALKSTTLTASDPDNPAADASFTQTTSFNWRDQYVYAIGFAYDLPDQFILRGGYNYGRNPIPTSTMSPFFSLIGQHHVTLGLGKRIGGWEAAGALEYHLPEKVAYNNPELPLGDAEAKYEVLIAHLMVSYRW